MSRAKLLSLSTLVELSRSLRHYLGAGLTLVQVFRQQAKRGPAEVRALAADVADRLEKGDALEDALARHDGAFPPLFVDLLRVGERSGRLPDVAQELEKYFRFQQQLRRQFWGRVAWPLFQYFAATLVLAGMLFVLGLFGSDFDPLGLGLTGTGGALAFLGIVWGLTGLVVVVILLLRRGLRSRAKFDGVLLKWPVIGACLEAIALQRLCLALRMTLETGMSTTRAVKLSLRATGNGAYVAQTGKVVDAIGAGEELTAALARSRLLPEDFVNILANAEEAGSVPEVLAHQAGHYEEEATRRMARLTSAAAVAVWLVVGGLMVLAIFRMYLKYLNALNV